MVILIYPHHSRREINGDSCYVFYTALVRAILKKRPTWQFVIAFPDEGSGYSYVNDGFFRSANVLRLPIRLSPRRQSNAITFDGFWWDNLFHKYSFDVIFSNLPEVSDKIAHAGETSTWHTPVVTFHHYVTHSSLPYPFYPHLAYGEQVGALESTVNVFNSDHCLQMFLDNADKLLSAKWAARQRENHTKLPVCLLEEKPWTRRQTAGPPLVIYNHRLQAYKRWDVTFRILKELWDEGVKFRVRYTYVTPDNIVGIQSLPFVETAYCPLRGQYLEAIAEGDLNVTHTVHETFCISAVESMAYGQLLIAPKAITFPEITGVAQNGYSFLFESDEQSKELLRAALTCPDQRTKWGPVLREHVLAHYSAPKVAEGFVEVFEKAGRSMMGSEFSGEAEYAEGKDRLLKALFAENVHRTIKEVTNELYGMHVADRLPFSSQSMPNSRIMHVARKYGYHFKIESGDLRLAEGV